MIDLRLGSYLGLVKSRELSRPYLGEAAPEL
jgi:hypothetical protein